MREIEGKIAGVKGRWMTGLSGAESAPDIWKPHLGEGSEAELRLLVLVGQALQIGFAPSPSDPLENAKLLPALALPTMPETARSRFRRLLSVEKLSAEAISPILELIEARGYTVHPSDWMPGRTDTDASSIYGPWIDWLNDGEGGSQEATLDAENWDNWYPAERREALHDLRRREPETARTLLEARAADVPAEERLRLVGILSERLAEADIPYLESLEKDRSGKVRTRAAQLLARLGATQTDEELVSELTDMLSFGRAKSPDQSKSLGLKKLKNDAQRKRRIELFALVPLHAIAAVFESTPTEVVENWNVTSNKQANFAFAEMVAHTGEDTVQPIMAQRLMAANELDAMEPLIARLDPDDRFGLIKDALTVEGDRFELALDLSRPSLGTLEFAEIAKGKELASIIETIGELAKATDNTKWRNDQYVGSALRALGLLLDPQGADALIQHTTKAGLLSADPRLNLLYLNMALPPRSNT